MPGSNDEANPSKLRGSAVDGLGGWGNPVSPDSRLPKDAASMPPSSQAALFALAAWALSALHYATFFDIEKPIFTDNRYFLYFAWRIAEGDIAHLELFDNKTFLSNFVGAALYKIADTLGIDPLHFIRASMLALASLGGLLAYWVFRRIGQGRIVVGFLGLFALLGFGILGELPAVGNFPKLVMGLLIPAAALSVARGWWFTAGVCGALAFMDWQVGALVGVASVATALLSKGNRVRSATRVIAGGLFGLAPFVLYFALNGALGAAVEQTFGMALARASDSLETVSLSSRIGEMIWAAGKADPDQRALMVISLAGLPLSWAGCWHLRGTSAGRMLLTLSLAYTGLFVFSLNDFQRFGDFYVLMLISAFWLGITWTGLLFLLEHRFGRDPGRRRVIAAVLLLATGLAARPLLLRPPIDLRTKHVPQSVTLSDQRALAGALRERIGDEPFIALASSEILFLMRQKSALPIIYLNVPSHVYNSRSPGEPIEETAARLIEEVGPERFIYPQRKPIADRLEREYHLTTFQTPSGDYVVRIYERN